jgi:hypothetical protein
MEEILMRAQIIAAIKNTIQPLPHVIAFYEGGSVAMGRADQWSDLDLHVVVHDGTSDDTWPVIEQVLQSIGPIDQRYVIPQPSSHGHWQAFYRLESAGPLLLVDLVIMAEHTTNRSIEPEIHGTPLVYFDKTGWVVQPPTDSAEFALKLAGRIPQLEVAAEILHPFVGKELLRGRPVDSFVFYQGLVISRLVEALRMRYAPWRYNFGSRYLQEDLPPAVYEAVEALFFVGSPAELPAKLDRAMSLLRATLSDLKRLDLVAHLEQRRST